MTSNSFWKGRHVIVTGASSGIGEAFADLMAERGARLGLIARRSERLDEIVARLTARGAAAAAAVADVVDESQMRAAAAHLQAQLGPCDVLVANAGVHRFTRGDAFSAAEANLIIQTNVSGVINAIAPVLPEMVARRSGHVVCVASIAAMLGLPEVAAYSASKSACVTLMESLRLDLGQYGVRVTTICPGFVDTPLISNHSARVLRWVLTARQAAERIAWAVERNKREYWFPWQTVLIARLARSLPFSLYRLICSRLRRRAPGGRDAERAAPMPRPQGVHD